MSITRPLSHTLFSKHGFFTNSEQIRTSRPGQYLQRGSLRNDTLTSRNLKVQTPNNLFKAHIRLHTERVRYALKDFFQSGPQVYPSLNGPTLRNSVQPSNLMDRLQLQVKRVQYALKGFTQPEPQVYSTNLSSRSVRKPAYVPMSKRTFRNSAPNNIKGKGPAIDPVDTIISPQEPASISLDSKKPVKHVRFAPMPTRASGNILSTASGMPGSSKITDSTLSNRLFRTAGGSSGIHQKQPPAIWKTPIPRHITPYTTSQNSNPKSDWFVSVTPSKNGWK